MTLDFSSYLATEFPLTLAQNGQEGAPGLGGAATTTGEAGTLEGGTPTGAPPQSPFGGGFLTIMLVMVGAMLLFSMLGSRKERKKREEMINAIKKHDVVQTSGGVIGSIVEVKTDKVILKVDESSNTRITFSRGAIAQVLSADAKAGPVEDA